MLIQTLKIMQLQNQRFDLETAVVELHATYTLQE